MYWFLFDSNRTGDYYLFGTVDENVRRERVNIIGTEEIKSHYSLNNSSLLCLHTVYYYIICIQGHSLVEKISRRLAQRIFLMFLPYIIHIIYLAVSVRTVAGYEVGPAMQLC